MDVVWAVLQSLNFDATTFFIQIALFFVLHSSMSFLIYKPMMKIREERDQKISQGLGDAEEAASEARRLKNDYEEKVRLARAEGRDALQQAIEIAERERKTRVDKARDEAAQLLRTAREEAEAGLAAAEGELDSQSDLIAKAIVSRLVTSSLGATEGDRLLSKNGGAS